MQSAAHTAPLVTSAAAVSYMTASSEDMRVACADGNLLAMTAITGGTDGADWSVVCVNRALATATVSASTSTSAPTTSAPSTEDGLSFVPWHQRHNGLPQAHAQIATMNKANTREPITVKTKESEYVTYMKLIHMSNTDQCIHV